MFAYYHISDMESKHQEKWNLEIISSIWSQKGVTHILQNRFNTLLALNR